MTFKGGAEWLKRKNNLQTVQEKKQNLKSYIELIEITFSHSRLGVEKKSPLFYNFML